MGPDLFTKNHGIAAVVVMSAIAVFSASASASFAEAGNAQTRLAVTKRDVSVTAGNTIVIVDKHPLRLQVLSRTGPVLLDSGPRGGLGFTVGADQELVPPSLDGKERQVQVSPDAGKYLVTRVLSVRKRRGVVRIRLATDGPAGSKALLKISGGRSHSARLRTSVTSGRKITAVSSTFRSPSEEAFRGFGARRESTDLRGSDITSWVLDYRFPDASTGYYAPVPGFISSRKYGVLLEGSRISRWQMAVDGAKTWRVNKAGNSMKLLIFPGGARKTMKSISSISGRHRLPPAWSTGPMLSRTIGVLTDGGDKYQERVEADVDRILKGDVPVSSYGFEGWATMPLPQVKNVVSRLKKRGIRSFLYIRSFVSNDIAGTETPGAYDCAIEHNLVATDAGGEPYLQPSPFPGGTAAVIDFTNPAARRWWKSRIFRLLNTGARGFMNDFGEQVVPEMHFADGTMGRSMHNRYPTLQAKVTRKAINKWKRRHPGEDEVFFFQRAGFSGKPGSAAYENAQFPGDETVDWDSGTGLPSIVPDMLNRAVMGAPGFTVDIGGYAQFTKEHPVLPPTSAELFTRWSQAAVFTPFFRVHNSGLNGAKMPWDFDKATLANWKRMAKLHDRARPLTKRLWKRFRKTGVPMIRPLWMVDPAGARGLRGDDEWLLGRDLLVAPAMAEGATSRLVRLPPGCWRLSGKDRRLKGARTIEARSPITVLPWFTRCGTRPLQFHH